MPSQNALTTFSTLTGSYIINGYIRQNRKPGVFFYSWLTQT
jgi:hypothetical protein